MSNETTPKDATFLTFSQAAKLPRLRYNGRGPNITTVWRWAEKGVTRGGRIFKLEAARIGGRRVTTSQWVSEFLERLDNPTAPVSETPSARRESYARAQAVVAAAGI